MNPTRLLSLALAVNPSSSLLASTMQLLFFGILTLVAVPVTVSACEGDCIVEITHAFLGNYSSPINTVLEGMVSNYLDILMTFVALTE